MINEAVILGLVKCAVVRNANRFVFQLKVAELHVFAFLDLNLSDRF
jgi:hypothetical protein